MESVDEYLQVVRADLVTELRLPTFSVDLFLDTTYIALAEFFARARLDPYLSSYT